MNARLTRDGEQLVEEDLAAEIMDYTLQDPRFTPSELAAIRYANQMWHDHTKMPDELWAEVEEHFSPEEIIELGFAVANYIGMGQFVAMLGLP